MAVRKRLLHDDATRQKIQVSQLINRLQANALGELVLDSTQQRSIEILLRKSLPDLQSIEFSGEVDATLSAVRWLTEAESQSSPISPEAGSSPSTSGPSDGPSLSVTVEPEKP